MRATIDIPDAIYRRIKIRAAQSSQTIRQLVLKGIDLVVEDEPADAPQRLSASAPKTNAGHTAARSNDPTPTASELSKPESIPASVEKLDARSGTRFEIPTIPSDRPGTLDLTNDQIYDLIGFP